MLTNKELSIVAFIGSSTGQAHAAINDGCRKAVRKAYSDMDDAGEFASEVYGVVLDIYKDRVARFFKRNGMNVTFDGTRNTKCIIGGVLDRSKQDSVFKKLDSDAAITGDVKQLPKKAPKVLTGYAQERAKKYLAASVKRLKVADPDAGAYLNDMLAKVDTVNPFIGLNLDASEVKACQDFITMMRMEPAFDEAVEVAPIAIAA